MSLICHEKYCSDFVWWPKRFFRVAQPFYATIYIDIKQHIYSHNLDNWSDILLSTNHRSARETKNVLHVYLLIVKSVTLPSLRKVWNQWYLLTYKECGNLEMKLHFKMCNLTTQIPIKHSLGFSPLMSCFKSWNILHFEFWMLRNGSVVWSECYMYKSEEVRISDFVTKTNAL